MKTFVNWAEDSQKELPVYQIEEKTARSSIAVWAYPDAAARSQYPKGYFVPKAADALQKLGEK